MVPCCMTTVVPDLRLPSPSQSTAFGWYSFSIVHYGRMLNWHEWLITKQDRTSMNNEWSQHIPSWLGYTNISAKKSRHCENKMLYNGSTQLTFNLLSQIRSQCPLFLFAGYGHKLGVLLSTVLCRLRPVFVQTHQFVTRQNALSYTSHNCIQKEHTKMAEPIMHEPVFGMLDSCGPKK